MGLHTLEQRQQLQNDIDNNVIKLATMRGLYLNQLWHRNYIFEMHRPSVRPCRLYRYGKVTAWYYETEMVPGHVNNHYHAKGGTYRSLESIEAAKQRRIDAGTWDGVWPGEPYRWCLFVEPEVYEPFPNEFQDTLFLGLQHGDLLKWRDTPVRGGAMSERTYEDEYFFLSCAGPLDINLDGVVDERDRDAFLANPYDWNCDGEEAGQSDIDDFLDMWETGELPVRWQDDGNFEPGYSMSALSSRVKPRIGPKWHPQYAKMTNRPAVSSGKSKYGTGPNG